MISDPHPLQVSAQSVIKSLYVEHNLPVTTALISYTNREYARLEDILDALDLHSNVEIVQKFCSQHSDEINLAREDILRSKESALQKLEEQQNNSASFEEVFGNVNVPRPQPAILKKFSVEEIETALSSALEKLTSQKLKVTINDLQFDPRSHYYSGPVNFKVEVSTDPFS